MKKTTLALVAASMATMVPLASLHVPQAEAAPTLRKGCDYPLATTPRLPEVKGCHGRYTS